MPGGMDLDRHRVAHAQYECTGILQSPGDVRDYERRVARHLPGVRLDRTTHRNRMGCAVQRDRPLQRYLRSSLRRHVAGEAPQCQGDLGILAALEDVAMHLAIAAIV